MSKYISAADTAKLIRAELKIAFPGIKFSVITRHSSSVNIEWTDGPTTKEVDAIGQQYKGADFDGMIDLETNVTHIVNGEEIHYGSKYVFATRKYSAAFLQHMIDHIMATYHFDADPQFTIIDGSYEAYIDARNGEVKYGSEYAKWFLMRLAQDVNDAAMPEIPVKEAQAEAEAVPAVEEARALLTSISQPLDLDALGMSIVADVAADLNAQDDDLFQQVAPVIGWNGEWEEVKPASKTQAEIDELKRQWAADPHWDIEGTPGFEAHVEELTLYHIEMRGHWKTLEKRQFIGHLAAFNVDSLSPLEALTRLYELKRLAAKLLE